MSYLESQSEANRAIARVVSKLDQSGCLRPVSDDPAERRLWHDHDLASTVESRLGVSID